MIPVAECANMFHFSEIQGDSISAQPDSILAIKRSRTFSYAGATTTWALTSDEAGDVSETVLELVFDVETTYPLDRQLDGTSGDYGAFIAAQQGGKGAARRYAARHSENAPGSDPSQYLARLRRLKAIRSRAARAEQRSVS